MTDRPLAKYDEGDLWMDDGGVYYPTQRFHVLMTARMFENRPGPDAARYVRDCRRALAQYDRAMEEADDVLG
jgi:hypothetical protein